MIIEGRTIVFKEAFANQLALIQEYIGQFSPKKARQLTTHIANFALDTIAPNPFMFSQYTGRPTPDQQCRRAVFKRKYIIIYRVTETEVVFLTIHHASQNPDGILLNEE